MEPTTSSYGANDITILEGLEPVRKRPGMYIGGVGKDGLHHLVWEIVDNSVDEAINGYASTIQVTLTPTATVTVDDNGRGIPVEPHPKDKAGRSTSRSSHHAARGRQVRTTAYRTAGGLHGVGASVVNALSSSLWPASSADGKTWEQKFRRGKPLAPVAEVGPARGTGTFGSTSRPTPDLRETRSTPS
jgi:DNA gyrase/topoisomerase IV subunit B